MQSKRVPIERVRKGSDSGVEGDRMWRASKTERWALLCFAALQILSGAWQAIVWYEYVPIPGIPHDNSRGPWLLSFGLATAFVLLAMYRPGESLWPITRRERVLLFFPAAYGLVFGVWQGVDWARYVPSPGYPRPHPAWPWLLYIGIGLAFVCMAFVLPKNVADGRTFEQRE